MAPSRAARTALLLVVLQLSGCAAAGRIGASRPEEGGGGPLAATGVASFISPGLAGRRTASGARFDPELRVAAHRTLPFGTRIRVTNLANHREVVVTVVDRGPFRRGRIVDVSPGAARSLGFLRKGLARVRIEVLGTEDRASADER